MKKSAILILLLFLLVFFVVEFDLKIDKNLTTTTTVPAISYRTVSLKVPAVDNDGNGVVTNLMVSVQPGQGRVLTDVNNLLFWVDTQYSIRTAQRVAQDVLKNNLTGVDLIYSIDTNASLIEGPSAGAALTIATIAAVEDKNLNQSVMITGTINPDGTIGPIGAVAEKAKASKDVGATLFLVPTGQGTEVSYKPTKSCERMGPILYCTTKYVTETNDISKSVGISVKEVSTIDEALKYFLI